MTKCFSLVPSHRLLLFRSFEEEDNGSGTHCLCMRHILRLSITINYTVSEINLTWPNMFKVGQIFCYFFFFDEEKGSGTHCLCMRHILRLSITNINYTLSEINLTWPNMFKVGQIFCYSFFFDDNYPFM